MAALISVVTYDLSGAEREWHLPQTDTAEDLRRQLMQTLPGHGRPWIYSDKGTGRFIGGQELLGTLPLPRRLFVVWAEDHEAQLQRIVGGLRGHLQEVLARASDGGLSKLQEAMQFAADVLAREELMAFVSEFEDDPLLQALEGEVSDEIDLHYREFCIRIQAAHLRRNIEIDLGGLNRQLTLLLQYFAEQQILRPGEDMEKYVRRLRNLGKRLRRVEKVFRTLLETDFRGSGSAMDDELRGLDELLHDIVQIEDYDEFLSRLQEDGLQ
eukprot:TRINITY_DN49588_c0_g1_i1.p1 TRINITY_DN49588_c0_g1~~TRINITY_DN49588_c0_g1_i1.p1  ORF type:complete len:269 (-),score=49.55 TRINITY_DN49588_c0_g1_i1:521-1327(-)